MLESKIKEMIRQIGTRVVEEGVQVDYRDCPAAEVTMSLQPCTTHEPEAKRTAHSMLVAWGVFARYVEGRGRLRQFRTEAVRAGFVDAWHRRDYATIVNVAEGLPDRVLQEDPDLLMYYDNATLRAD